MRWWAGKHLGGVAFVPPHGKPRLSYCVKYCEPTALVAVRLDCVSFCRLCQIVRDDGLEAVGGKVVCEKLTIWSVHICVET